MKILIITENVGRTSPGIVFERLIKGLTSKNEVDLLTCDYDPSIDLGSVAKFQIIDKRYLHPRIYKFLISFFTINPFDYFWSLKALSTVKLSRDTYDVILCFMSFHHYSSIVAGKLIARHTRSKLAILSVDAVPAPIGWPENALYRRGVLKLMSRYLSFADVFLSANRQMLDYQLNTFRNKNFLLSEVIYSPCIGDFAMLPRIDYNNYNFVYTGSIYGARKSEYLLNGFQKLLKSFPNSNLIFVGTRIESLPLSELMPETLLKISIIPFTRDLNYFYSIATALIDIDADIKNDVFFSGKMANYLMIDRVIISETGVNSPSRNLLNNLNSVIQCDHNSDHICEAMKVAIIIRDKVDFNDRGKVLEMFKLENVMKKLNSVLEKL
jgi:hypothetical protein